MRTYLVSIIQIHRRMGNLITISTYRHLKKRLQNLSWFMIVCSKKLSRLTVSRKVITNSFLQNNNRKGAVTNVLSQLPFFRINTVQNSFLKNRPKFHKNLKNNE